MKENLAAFFADFGIEVVVVGDGHSFKGILDKPISEQAIGGYPIESQLPTVVCIEEETQNMDLDLLQIQGRMYKVLSAQPDGTGLTKIQLDKHEF